MNAPQGSEAWLLERAGRATASCFSDVLAKGQGKTRAAYMRRVLAERLTGKPIETYQNSHMDRGTEQEPYARMEYEVQTGSLVEQVGFIPHPEIMAGASPDGLVDTDGGVEIKSVIPTVQVETLLRGGYPPEHRPQIQGNLWIANRRWWDFASYCPDMPEHLRLYVFRVERDERYIETLAGEVVHFLDEVDALYLRLMQDHSTFHESTLLDQLIASVDANHPASQA